MKGNNLVIDQEYTHIESADDFTRWATYAKKDDRITYYKGLLMRDRQLNINLFGAKDKELPEFQTANKALEFSDLGIVKLFQMRHGDADYSYIAVKE